MSDGDKGHPDERWQPSFCTQSFGHLDHSEAPLPLSFFDCFDSAFLVGARRLRQGRRPRQRCFSILPTIKMAGKRYEVYVQKGKPWYKYVSSVIFSQVGLLILCIAYAIIGKNA
jgi:hypothetical protein